jgi:hypothetical protein
MNKKDFAKLCERLSPAVRQSITAQLPLKGETPRRSKYGAVAVVVDGIHFPSDREAKRYKELLLLQKLGEVRWIARQGRFSIEGGEYRPDFIVCWSNGAATVEDAKGVRTPIYLRSKKQMLQRWGVVIEEV